MLHHYNVHHIRAYYNEPNPPLLNPISNNILGHTTVHLWCKGKEPKFKSPGESFIHIYT